MLLLHPEASLFQELVAVVGTPRHVGLLDLMPHGTALLRTHRGIQEHFFLEFIDAHQIRYIRKAVCQMRIAVFICVFSEEQFHPGIGPVFHCHRVDLRDLCAGMALFHERQGPVSRKTLECMTGFMGQNIHIGTGSVEIGEDKGHPDTRKRGAVSAALLAGFGFEVEHLIFDHPVKESAGLR